MVRLTVAMPRQILATTLLGNGTVRANGGAAGSVVNDRLMDHFLKTGGAGGGGRLLLPPRLLLSIVTPLPSTAAGIEGAWLLTLDCSTAAACLTA